MATDTIKIEPRDVTEDEANFFSERGWARLNGFIDRAHAELLQARMQDKMGHDAAIAAHPAGEKRGNGYEISWRTFAPVSIDHATGARVDDVFYGFSHSGRLGAAAASLLGGPVRYWVDEALVKTPAGVEGSGQTPWHQDIGSRDKSPFDPPRQLQVWMALTEITPELGSLRFVSAKDADESVVKLLKETESVEESYERLEELGIISPAAHMVPGDVTVHDGSTWHSAPPNRTDRVRWVYITSLFDASARFSGKHYWPSENVDGVQEGQLFPDHRYPVLA